MAIDLRECQHDPPCYRDTCSACELTRLDGELREEQLYSPRIWRDVIPKALKLHEGQLEQMELSRQLVDAVQQAADIPSQLAVKWQRRALAHAPPPLREIWTRVDLGDGDHCACGNTWRFEEERDAGICAACVLEIQL